MNIDDKDAEEKMRADIESWKKQDEKMIMLENQLKQAFENLDKAESRLNWLERFLQNGGTSISSVPYYTIEDHPDDTDETYFNVPFQIGISVEKENRGCYEWIEFSNGAKGIRPAIDAAKIKYDEWRKQFSEND